MTPLENDPPPSPLAERIDELPREIAPEHDLWPAIAQRLTPREQSAPPPRRVPFAAAPWLAAAALLALGIGVGFWLRGAGAPAAAPEPSPGGVVLASAPNPTAAQLALGDYRAATTALRQALDARLTGLDATVRQVVEDEMVRIDAAIAEIERALEASPDDALLESFLLARYRQQVDLLSRWLPAAG